MRYRDFLGRKTSVLCMGSVGLGFDFSQKQTNEILDAYVNLGGNFIDTARVYGDFAGGVCGVSERAIGNWLAARHNREKMILGTKGGLRIPSTECWNGSFDKPMTLYHDVAGAPVETTIPLIEDKSDLWDKKIRSFLDAIITGGKAPVPTSQILYNQAIIDGIAKSHAAGKEIKNEIPEI